MQNKKLYSDIQVQDYFASVEWAFCATGGKCETTLRKVLGNARLIHDELLTVLLKIEGTLNSLPLTYEYDEIGSKMLTPSHLLFGFGLSTLPDVIPREEQECESV